jgi:hypothetical protein
MKSYTLLFLLCFFCSCGKYNVKHYGCESPYVNERFDSGFLVMPNIFSPNGDGVNDILFLYSKGVSSIFLKIRDNGGEVVFEGNINYAVTDSLKAWPAWDGQRNKGLLTGLDAKLNNYRYVLDYTMANGCIKILKGNNYGVQRL